MQANSELRMRRLFLVVTIKYCMASAAGLGGHTSCSLDEWENMIMKTTKYLAAASLALILLAACGSAGDILGGSGQQQSNYEIRGTVDSVDLNSRSIYLTNVTGYTSMLSNGGSAVRVYYDDRTPVEFNGQSYRPTDLERGDQVTVRVDESGNTLMAESVSVTRDVSSGSSYPTYPSGSYESNIRGTVRYIDTSRRTIEVDRGNGSTTFVEFETNTPVYFNNQTYNPVDLERGDEIDIRTRDLGNGRFLAQDISVIRSISSNGSIGGSGSTQTSTIRGTVRNIDTYNHTIELESTNWISGFNSGTSSSRTIIHFDTNVGINVNGRTEALTGLERGDVIEAQVTRDSSGSTLWAQRLSLIRDVNSR
jgi:predicted RNA-binding protein